MFSFFTYLLTYLLTRLLTYTRAFMHAPMSCYENVFYRAPCVVCRALKQRVCAPVPRSSTVPGSAKRSKMTVSQVTARPGSSVCEFLSATWSAGGTSGDVLAGRGKMTASIRYIS